MDNPFVGATFYRNVDYVASVNAAADLKGGVIGQQMRRVANYPTFLWLDSIAAVNGTGSYPRGLAGHLDQALLQGANAIGIVIYDLPNRDGSALASNGELLIAQNGLNRYKTEYIDAIYSIISQTKYSGLRIVMVIEPDSLPNLITNLSFPRVAEANSTGAYVQGVQYAIGTLRSLTNTYAYIDVAHAGWLGWPSNLTPFVNLLKQVGTGIPGGNGKVDGFISNTANYNVFHEPYMTANQMIGGNPVRSLLVWYDWNDHIEEQTYANALRTALVSGTNAYPAGVGLLLDTSRNGWGGPSRPSGPSTSTVLSTFVRATTLDKRIHKGNWGNQSGAGIGVRPMANPSPNYDAFVWVKPPGESDGSSSLIPVGPENPDGKGFDRMCDPTYHGNSLNGNQLTGALPDAPVSGRWFQSQFEELVQNAFPAFTSSISVTFAITNTWPTGYNAEVTVANQGDTAVNGWTLEFDFAGTITNIWNGDIASHTGTHYVIQNVSSNAGIDPGASVVVGFTADPADRTQPPTNYVFNGVAVSGSSSNLSITTNTLPDASVGSGYSQTLTATGGNGPYSWSISAGALPENIMLSAAGLLSGTPVSIGTSNFTVTVSDSSTPVKTAVKALSLAITTLPGISINNPAVMLTPAVSGSGYLSTSGNQIVDSAGAPVRITGINWFGFETINAVFHGLWTRNYKEALGQIKQLGFNTIRVPFSNEMLRPGATTQSINFYANPDLQGLSPLQCLDKVIGYCGEIGLRVLLDRHSAKADHFLSEDVWFIAGDSYYTEQRWIDDWVMLANRYAGNPTVIGADLFNEPKRTASWGNSAPLTDWNKAAERCGNAVLAANPRWLIIVEGVQTAAGASYWWGGNLKGTAANPVLLQVPNKLVYSMHDYPASVSAQPWFSAANYPANLVGVWDGYWGYLFKNNTAPLLLGEFGTKLATQSDQQWIDKLTDYIDGDFDLNGTNDLVAGQKGISWTYWCWNPNSGDTGGILNDDWTTVNTAKLATIQASMAPLLAIPGGSTAFINFTVTLSQAASSAVSVNWTTVSGTAIAGTDFTTASGTLTFTPGEITKTITIALLPITTPSGVKTFSVQLGTPSGATLSGGTGTGNLAAGPWHYWRSLHFTLAQLADPLVSGGLADPAATGFPNLVRYAFGAAPNAVVQPPAPAITGGRLSLTFSRNAEAPDLTLTVQAANSPAGPWSGLAESTGGEPFQPFVDGVAVSETGTGTIRTVKVTDLPVTQRRFLRLRVGR